MGRYRKKPIEIEAFRFLGESNMNPSVPSWFVEAVLAGSVKADTDGVDITTLEGVMRANAGDWIIRGVKGELYPCKPDIFDATYEIGDKFTAMEINTIPSTAMRAVDEEDKTLERAAHVGDEQQHNLGKFAGEQPYRKPRDKRVQKLLTEAQRSRDAETEREAEPPRKIYTDPRIKAPEWKPPRDADKSE